MAAPTRTLALALLVLLSGCNGERAPQAPGARPAPVDGARVEAVALTPVQDAVDVTSTVRTRTQMPSRASCW
jgi:hypothetical protein